VRCLPVLLFDAREREVWGRIIREAGVKPD
jgi:hypothetical protein